MLLWLVKLIRNVKNSNLNYTNAVPHLVLHSVGCLVVFLLHRDSSFLQPCAKNVLLWKNRAKLDSISFSCKMRWFSLWRLWPRKKGAQTPLLSMLVTKLPMELRASRQLKIVNVMMKSNITITCSILEIAKNKTVVIP